MAIKLYDPQGPEVTVLPEREPDPFRIEPYIPPPPPPQPFADTQAPVKVKTPYLPASRPDLDVPSLWPVSDPRPQPTCDVADANAMQLTPRGFDSTPSFESGDKAPFKLRR